MHKPTLWTWLALMAGAIPALADPSAIQRASDLHAAAQVNPFFVAEHALLLYVWAPIVALSACVLFMTPGFLATRALGTPRSLHQWTLRALAASIGLVSVAAGSVQSLGGVSLQGRPFAWFVVGLSSLLAFVAARTGGPASMPWWPHAWWARLRLVLSLVGVPFALLVVLTPKFYWEVFNGDGAHAFESTRLLLTQSLPFFAPEVGSEFPGLTSMLFAFPGSWFIRLFGENEAAARLPFVLYLPALYAALSELSVCGRETLSRAGHAVIWLSLTAYTLAMAFSATYSPYSADIALPATQDTLLVTCVLGAMIGFVERRPGWTATFAVLTYLSLPSGMLLLGMWMVAAALVWRPVPTSALAWWGATLIACVVGGAVATLVIRVAGLPMPGSEYGAGGLLRYFAFLQFTDLRRILYVALPGGLLPACSLLLWRRQDAVSRALTLTSTGYFLFFFIQANVSLHHFVPSMLLPIPVLWRTMPMAPRQRQAWIAAAAVAGVAAVLLCLPPRATIDSSARAVGAALDDRLGGYAVASPTQLAGAMLLDALFPKGFDPRVPEQSYGGSPLSWNHYARHLEPPSQPAAALPYVLQRADAAPPSGATLVAQRGEAALYVRDEQVWQSHRALRPATPPGSRWLSVPRSTLFRSVPASGGPRVYNVVSVLQRMGVDTDAVMARLGIRPPS